MRYFVNKVLVAFAACALPWSSIVLAAEDFPNRPVRFIVPYPPGGGNDDMARLLGQKLSENLRQPFVVENRAGASGMIAGDLVAKSKPDGYTIMNDNSGILMNVSLYPNITYDVRRDLTAVMMTVAYSNMLLVHPSVSVRNVAELLALAKAQPGKLNYASPGNGSPQHIAMEMLKQMSGADIVHIPYKGGAPATTAALAGEVQMLLSATSGLPHVKSGKLKPLATTGSTRMAALPDVPTVSESGLKGYFDTGWQGIFSAPRTPPAIVTRLNGEFAKVLALPEIVRQLADRNYEVVRSSPEAFSKAIEEGVAQYAKVIREANIKAD
jgi:tripartite-type tricarboxylate transporter receptor subunit TctC